MSKMICPNCLMESDILIERKNEIHKIKRDIIEAAIESSVCSLCKEEFSTINQMENNLEVFRSVYRNRHGIISPQEIIALRKRYDVSQKTLGKLLDIGELTINSYEQGALPSGAHNNLLRIIAHLGNFRELYERNKKKISQLQVRKIEVRLNKLRKDETIMVAEPASEYHGLTVHDMERILSFIQNLNDVNSKAIFSTTEIKMIEVIVKKLGSLTVPSS